MSASHEMALTGMHLPPPQPQRKPRHPRQRRFIEQLRTSPSKLLGRAGRRSRVRESRISPSASPAVFSHSASASTLPARAAATNGPTPDVKDYLRGMDASSLGERTWSSESSVPGQGDFGDDGERRISGRWSRDLARGRVHHQNRGCSLGVMLNVNVEYDDVQQMQLPQIQYVKDMDEHADSVCHGSAEVEWRMRNTCGASHSTSATVQRDDTATTPWDTPSAQERQREEPHAVFSEASQMHIADLRVIQPRQPSFPRQLSFPSRHDSHTDAESAESRPSSPGHYVSPPRQISESHLIFPTPVSYVTRPKTTQQPYIPAQLSGAPGQTPMTPAPQPPNLQILTRPSAPLRGSLSNSGSSKQPTASQSPKTRSRPRTPVNQAPLSLEHSSTLKDRRPSSRPTARSSSQKSAKPVHRPPAQPLPPRRNTPGSPHNSPIRSYSPNGGPLRHSLPPSEPPSLQPRMNGPDIYRPESRPKSSASQIRAPVGTQMKDNFSPQIRKTVKVEDISSVPDADFVHNPEPGESSSSMQSEPIHELIPYAPPLPSPPASPVACHISNGTNTSRPQTPSQLAAEEQLREYPEASGYTDESDSSRPPTPLQKDIEGRFQKSPSMRSFLEDSESSRPQTPSQIDIEGRFEKSPSMRSFLDDSEISTMELSMKSQESVKSPLKASESPEPRTASKKDIEEFLRKSSELQGSPDDSASSPLQAPPQASVVELSGTSIESARRLSDASESSLTQCPSQTKEVDQPQAVSPRSPTQCNLDSPIQQSGHQSPALLKCLQAGKGLAMRTPLDLPESQAIVKLQTTTSAKEPQRLEVLDPSPNPEGKLSKASSQNKENQSTVQDDSAPESTTYVLSASSEVSTSRLPQKHENAGQSETAAVSRVSSANALSRNGDTDLAPLFQVNQVSEKSPKQNDISDIGAADLIRKTSKRPWDKGFDGIPRNKWANAVIRATSRSFEPPIDKHVRTVLEGIRKGGSPTNNDTPVGAVLLTIKDRFSTPQWTIRLKTALFCHTVFRGGISKFVEHVARTNKELFDARKFVVDGAFDACEKSQLHKSFAEEYARYLQAWLSMKAEAKFPAGRTHVSSSRRFKSASPQDLLKSLPKLIDTLGRVAPLELHPGIEDSSIADAVISLVLKDSKTIVNALDAGMNRLVELYPELPGQYSVDALRVYGSYRKVLGEVKPVLHRMNGEESAWMRSLDVAPRLPGRRGIHRDGWKGNTATPQRIRITDDPTKRKDATVKPPMQRDGPPQVHNQAREMKNAKKGGGVAKLRLPAKPAYKIYDDETQETEVVISVGTDDVDLLFGPEDVEQRPSAGREAVAPVQEDEDFPIRSRYPSD